MGSYLCLDRLKLSSQMSSYGVVAETELLRTEAQGIPVPPDLAGGETHQGNGVIRSD